MSTYHVVTGAAGFIGSNLVRALNRAGVDRIIAVDNLRNADKFVNLVDCEIADYVDKNDFLEQLAAGTFDGVIEAVLHQGACSDTTRRNGRYMMQNNYRYSRTLLDHCQENDVPLIYASSAAVYGGGSEFREERCNEGPLNVYGYSKFLFDQIVRRRGLVADCQVVGLRYFNVYGPGEAHKGRMASVASHLFQQYRSQGEVRLFEGCDGYGNGEQQRDFVHVDDVVAVNLFFLEHPELSGIFNLGTGRARTFNDIALATVNACRAAEGRCAKTLSELVAEGGLRYIPFPDDLRGRYQSHTQADIGALRRAGYAHDFVSVEDGVRRYVDWMLERDAQLSGRAHPP